MSPQIIIAMCIFAAGFASGWGVNGWRRDARELVRIEAATKELRDMTDDRDAKDKALAIANDTNTAQLRKAQNETNRLRDCLRAGTCGLRVAATCPDQGTADAGAPSLDNGAGAKLNGTAEQAYFALRDGINRASAQLDACQSELKIRSAVP